MFPCQLREKIPTPFLPLPVHLIFLKTEKL